MMQLRETKATPSALVEGATQGDTTAVTRNGQPCAVPVGLDEGDVLPPRDLSAARDATL